MRISWQTALIVCVAIVAIASTAILGPLAGLDAETLRYVLGAQGAIGVIVAGVSRALLGGER